MGYKFQNKMYDAATNVPKVQISASICFLVGVLDMRALFFFFTFLSQTFFFQAIPV